MSQGGSSSREAGGNNSSTYNQGAIMSIDYPIRSTLDPSVWRRLNSGGDRWVAAQQNMVLQDSDQQINSNAARGVNRYDKAGLIHLFNTTDGPNWLNTGSWTRTENPSLWQGVTMNEEGRVIRLKLSGSYNLRNIRGSIPPELGQLGALKELDLSVNELSGSIPSELGQLSALEVLNLSGNHLSGSIPPELGRLGALKKLLLWSNELTGVVPEELGRLTALKTLLLTRNKLTVFPRALGESFIRTEQLKLSRALYDEGAVLQSNPWIEPPWEVISGGWENIINYYDAVTLSGVTTVHKFKVVFLGAVLAGKTSLAKGLLQGEPALTLDEERTRGVDMHIQPWRPDPNQPLEVIMWDFAGHADYYSTHQMFLTDGALQLLVVDLHKFHVNPCSRGNAVFIWLDALLCRIPGCIVMAVATHADRFNGDRGQVRAALDNLEAAITKHLQDKYEEWKSTATTMAGSEKHRDTEKEPPSLTFCGVVEASGGSKTDLDMLGGELCRLAGTDGVDAGGKRLFLNVGQKIPVSWARASAVMDALHEGAEPTVAAKLSGKPLVQIEGFEKLKLVTWEKALDEWSTAVETLGLSAEVGETREDEDRVLEAALKMRQLGGTMLVSCGLVHLEPSWINELLRALLDHRVVDPAEIRSWDEKLIAYCNKKHIAFDELDAVHEKFKNVGRLTKHYVEFLWRDIPEVAGGDVVSRMLSTLSKHGAVFRCECKVDSESEGHKGDEEELMVPARLPSRVGADTLLDLKSAISDGVRMQLIVEIHSGYVPAGLIAQFLGALGNMNRIVFRACWAEGAAFLLGGIEHLICLHEPTDVLPRRIEIDTAGSSRKEVSDPGFDLRDRVRDMLKKRYRGLLFKSSGQPLFSVGHQAWNDRLDSLQDHLEHRSDKLERALASVLDRVLEVLVAYEEGRVMSQAKLLNGIDNKLVERMHELRLGIREDLSEGLGERVEAKLRYIEAEIQGISIDGLGGLSKDVFTGISSNVARVRWPVPRLACLLPEHIGSLSEDDRTFGRWSARVKTICTREKPEGRRILGGNLRHSVGNSNKLRRRLRLFFLCAHDCSLAECGPDGQGYEVTELLQWVKKAKPFAKVGVILASIVVKTCTGLSVPTDHFNAAFGDAAGGAISDILKQAVNAGVEGMASKAAEGLSSDGDEEKLRSLIEAQKVDPRPADGFEYDRLKEAIRGFEVKCMKGRKGNTTFRSFDSAMEFVDKGGQGVEWAWVRTINVVPFTRCASSVP